jgi:hypothetical protein
LATGDRTRLTPGEGRRFALTLAAAFAVLAAVCWWRSQLLPATVLVVVSALLTCAGLVAPTRLGGVQRAWMAFAEGLSKVTTPVFMGIVYYAVLTPTGLLRRLVAGNSLRTAHGKPSGWVNRRASPHSDLTRQF